MFLKYNGSGDEITNASLAQSLFEGQIGHMPVFVPAAALIVTIVFAVCTLSGFLVYWGGRFYRRRVKRLATKFLENFNDHTRGRMDGAIESDVLINYDAIEVTNFASVLKPLDPFRTRRRGLWYCKPWNVARNAGCGEEALCEMSSR